MRPADLTEATVENMQVLRDCMDMIIDNLPYRLPANQSVRIYGRDLSGLQRLYQKYQRTAFADVIQKLADTLLVFNNEERRKDSSTMGAYLGLPHNQLVINISAFMKSADDVTRSDLLRHRIMAPIKTFRAILLHELRHFFQSHLFHRYFYSNREEEYRKSPVEIDAAWKHHLEDYSVSDYPSVSAYVDAVMKSFIDYKHLMPRQIEHFRRKTIRYYLDHAQPQQTDALSMPARQRLAAIRERTKALMLDALKRIERGYDLRELDGYNPNSSRFLLPSGAVHASAATIAKDKEVSPTAAPVIFLVMALVTPPEHAMTVLRHLRGVQKVTLADALGNAENSFTGGWDIDAMKRLISKTFGKRGR